MVVYYLLLLLIVGLGTLLTYRYPSKRNKIIFLVLTFGYMWVLNTFRKDIGYDYQSYINIFETIKSLDLATLFKHITREARISGIPTEPGYAIITWAMGQFISSHIVMYGVYNLIIMLPIAWFIYKYCDDAWLSVWLYVTMFFFFTNMSFTRQSIACSIALLGFNFFREKKTIPFLIIALLAASMQYSALILIPIYIATFIPLNRYTITGYVVLVVTTFLTSEYILDFVTQFIYSGYKGQEYLTNRLGGSYMVIPTAILVAALALYPIWRKRDKYATTMLTVVVISSTFWLFGSFKHMIIERFCMYTYIYALYTLPAAIASLKASPEKLTEQAELVALSQKRKLITPQTNQLESIGQYIKDHVYYYWSAAVALLLITLIYFYSGTQIRPTDQHGFHGVYGMVPYQSHIELLHTDSPEVAAEKEAQLAQDETQTVQ